jgi:ABC-type lipoprotein release transport system permease subunit
MAIVTGLSGGLLGVAFASGYVKQLVDSVINMETSHLILQADSFNINQDLCYYLNNSDSLMAEISKSKKVEALSSRLRVIGNINSARSSAGVSFLGVNPELEQQVFQLFSTIPDTLGTFFAGKVRNPVIIGRALAENLGVGLNSRLVATFQTIEGEIISSVFRVAGIYIVDNKMFEKSEVFVLKNELATLTGFEVTNSNEIAIKLNGRLSEISGIRKELQEKFSFYRIYQWNEIRPEIGILHSYIGLMIGILVGIILLALSLGILNTMLMVVLERTQELGMLRAIGMNDKKVFLMVVLETVFLMLTGAIISMMITWFTLQWLGDVGVKLGFSAASNFDMNGGLERLYPILEWPQYLKVTLMVLVTGILSAIYPAKKVLKQNPAEAVRRLN